MPHIFLHFGIVRFLQIQNEIYQYKTKKRLESDHLGSVDKDSLRHTGIRELDLFIMYFNNCVL